MARKRGLADVSAYFRGSVAVAAVLLGLVSAWTPGGGNPGGGGTPAVVDIPSDWAVANAMSVPHQVAGKDLVTGCNNDTAIKNPTGQQFITSSTGVYYINALGLYEDYDFRGKRVVLTFTCDDPEAVKFKNCRFDNVYVGTGTAYFGADVTAGTVLRSDCSFEWSTFEGSQAGGSGECIDNKKGLVNAYRCKFVGWQGDWFNIGGGYIVENSFELGGNSDGAHYDIVNWADTSIGPLYYCRNYIDGTLGKYPNIGGAFNSLLKFVPTNGAGPTHDCVCEENVAWFSEAPNGEGDETTPANNGWYWFQNIGGSGQFRFKDNYVGMLRGGGENVFSDVPGSNFALQNFMKLHDNNTPWTGPYSDNTSTLPHPGLPVVDLVQSASASVATFVLGANTTFLEFQYRPKGESRWEPYTVPVVAVSGDAIGVGDGYEFRFRGVLETSGRRVTGEWVYFNQDPGTGETAPIITSPSSYTVAENQAFSVALAADQAVTWAIAGGADAALFAIDAGGVLSMAAQDYEAPADADANNVYGVTVAATANGLTGTKAIAVTVTNVAEGSTDTDTIWTAAGFGNSFTLTNADHTAELTGSGAGWYSGLFANVGCNAGIRVVRFTVDAAQGQFGLAPSDFSGTVVGQGAGTIGVEADGNVYLGGQGMSPYGAVLDPLAVGDVVDIYLDFATGLVRMVQNGGAVIGNAQWKITDHGYTAGTLLFPIITADSDGAVTPKITIDGSPGVAAVAGAVNWGA